MIERAIPVARISVAFYPPGNGRTLIRLAQTAERLGFDTFWIPDTHMIWGDPYVLLGAVAAGTERIRLGPGVTHPLVRHVTVTASAIATLGEMARGRVRLGIGIGSSGPASIGVRRVGARELETAIRTIRALVRGERLEEGERTLRLSFTGGQEVPISVGAISEHTLRVAGRVADDA
ncbi:MAG: LLM class flavin-dependent oxidoreductase, partial [candidate division NC10 bacterium]